MQRLKQEEENIPDKTAIARFHGAVYQWNPAVNVKIPAKTGEYVDLTRIIK
jgi:hypothetical protein